MYFLYELGCPSIRGIVIQDSNFLLVDFSFDENEVSISIFLDQFTWKSTLSEWLLLLPSCLCLFRNSFSIPLLSGNVYLCPWDVFLECSRMMDLIFCIHFVSLCLFTGDLRPLVLSDISDQWLLDPLAVPVLVLMLWGYLYTVFSRLWLTSLWWSFPSTIFCGTGLVIRYCLNSVLSWNSLFSPSVVIESFSRYSSLDDLSLGPSGLYGHCWEVICNSDGSPFICYLDLYPCCF